MTCIKTEKKVTTNDCEACFTNRGCHPTCVKRGFVWGNNREEPMWEFNIEQAALDKSDIGWFYDPNSSFNKREESTSLPKGKRWKPISKKLKLEIFSKDDFTCVICRTNDNLTIDHIVPRSKGGTEERNNLQTLCRSCNSRKGNRQWQGPN
jgi:hypothetical protein